MLRRRFLTVLDPPIWPWTCLLLLLSLLLFFLFMETLCFLLEAEAAPRLLIQTPLLAQHVFLLKSWPWLPMDSTVRAPGCITELPLLLIINFMLSLLTGTHIINPHHVTTYRSQVLDLWLMGRRILLRSIANLWREIATDTIVRMIRRMLHKYSKSSINGNSSCTAGPSPNHTPRASKKASGKIARTHVLPPLCPQRYSRCRR
mmetsp:Transcript_9886/g.22059  ORF Transcript_9886/g.22059 Transcript_9886/m.22059 type:complete len:203 (+) Transcript_9886:332-940(+)